MAKVLVTGGAGFIGSHLVSHLLEKGYEVVVMDTLLRGNKIPKEILSSVELHVEDVRDREAVIKNSKGCSMIFHFAAVLGVDIVADSPVETMEVEMLGMKNIADAAILHQIDKIIYASTSGVYGHSAIEKSVTETVQLDPRTSYAIAKRFNEIYLAALNEEKGINAISLRFFNVYGLRQDNRMVVPRFFEQCMDNEPITVFGNGFQTRDFTHVSDTVKSSLMLAEKINGCEIFNIANENEMTIKDLALKIKEVTQSKSEIQYLESPPKRYDFEVERRFGNSDKLQKFIGYKPNTSIETGLKEIYEDLLKYHNS